MRRRILFVDDEPKLLAGLRRMLRGLRHEWDMEFAESGPAALERLAAAPFDVLVTDMRMPGMDGAGLLQEVKKRYPSTVRVILSGQCDRRVVLKCVGPAHQFLTKPCDSETVKATIARACRLRDHLPDEQIKQAVSCVSSLPSQPSAYAELTAELDSGEASIQHVGQIISRDVGMSAKVLQLVSSGYLGTPQRVSEVGQAVRLVSLETIRELQQSTDVFSPLDEGDSLEGLWELFCHHSGSVAKAAARIAQTETDDATLIGDACLAGLLHDAGILVLARDSAERYLESLELARRERIPLAEAESSIFRISRDYVGAYLMGLWGLPDPIVRAIAYHLSPTRSADEAFGPLAAVHVANAVMEEEIAEAVGPASRIDADFLRRIGCADRLDAWREICWAAKPEGVPQ